MFGALKNQPKHIKIAIGVLFLLVIGSLLISPDKDFKIDGVTVSNEVIDLEEAKRQDEIYREKVRRQELGLDPLPENNPKQTKQAKKQTPKKEKTVNKAVKQEPVKKEKASVKKPEKVIVEKAPLEKAETKKEEADKQVSDSIDKKKINPVAEKTMEIHKRRLADKKNMQRIAQLLQRAPASMTELVAGVSEDENNHYYILVRASEYFDTKIFVNQKTRINVSGQNGIQSFPIPSELITGNNLVDICYFHNEKEGQPGVRQMVRVEILNTKDWPQERMPAMLNNLHFNPLRVSLSPTGKDFSPGDLNCESLLF
ncbi:MAG: hypothetical protein VX583_08120 [Bdellovibrionota bacterium]